MSRRLPLLPIALVGVLVIAVTWWIDDRGAGDVAVGDTGSGEVAVATDETTTTTTEPPYDGWSDPARSGGPWPEASVEGLLTFRGNPTRSFYGSGSVSKTEPQVAFRFPESGGMCGESTNLGTTKVWCGMGWTGQPTIFEREVDGVSRTWSVFGAYDGAVHFIDADTGERILPDFQTGDLIKGTVTIDPDGFPLVYTGSRDNKYRILSMDGDEPVELWSMHADDFSPTKWNDDWDSSGMIIDDYLFVGGENSQFVIVKLNRGYDAAGNVTVAPERAFNVPAWDEELLADIGDDTVSVESSPTVVANTVYFANSGGLIQGYDIEGLAEGVTPTRTFRFWTGDDTDASVVADSDGMLYVASEYERAGTAARSDVVGQLMKLDPTVPEGEDHWCGRTSTTACARAACGRHRPSTVTSCTPRPTAADCSASTGRPAPNCGRRTCPARCGARPSSSMTCCSSGTAAGSSTPTTCRNPGRTRRCCGPRSSVAASRQRLRSGVGAS